MEKDENTELNVEHKSNKKKRIFICIGILIVLIAIIATILVFYFKFKNNIEPTNIAVTNTGFHKLEIRWDHSEKIKDYEVIISSTEFTKEDIENDLKNGQFNETYKIVQVQNETRVEFVDLLSNTDYYIVVVGYHEKDGKITYSNPSQVIKVHTDSLEIGKIVDLSAKEVTEKSIELQWTPWNTDEKNLDETDIEIMYSIYSLNVENGETNLVMSDILESNVSILELNPITKYYYKIVVQAKVDNTIVSGEESETLEVKTKAESITNVKAKSGGTSSITVSWSKYDNDNLENITYDIYGSDNKNSEFELLKEGISEVNYTELNLSENKTRYYYVIAKIMIDDEIYESIVSNTVSATTDKKSNTTTSSSSKPTTNSSSTSNSSSTTSNQNSSSSNSGSSELSKSEKDAQARVIARQIAARSTGSTDLERVTKAAQAVSGYYYKGVHKESGPDYNTPYGVFIKGESSCAGCTRALGMVLEEMGYSWQHVNANQWTHQWVIINMDGQVGWADGQIGMAGYGTHPYV